MATPTDVRASQSLLEAYATGTPIAPLTETFPDLTLDDGYAIQRRQIQHWLGQGRVVQGHKVGLTSIAMQRQLGVDQPDYGVLRDDMFHDGYDRIDLARYLAPRVEPEIAFVLGHDLAGPGVTLAAAARAVEYVLPAIEIIDSRIRDWRIGIVDTIADNASSGGVVLGGHPCRPDDADLRLLGCNLSRGGQLVATGAGGAVLGSPLASLVWLANTLGRHEEGLTAGQVVLPGSVTMAQPVQAGDVWTATFARLGSVTARFVEAA